MKYDLHGVWNRPHGPIAIGETEVIVEGRDNKTLVVRVQSPTPIVLGRTMPRVARVTIEFDDDLWN